MIGLLVAAAGGLGAVARFLIDTWIGHRSQRSPVPLGTLLVNIVGSFLLGLLTGWWMFRTGDPGWKLVLGTGFLGGFTTFSTASVEAARLTRAGRGWTVLVHAGGMLLLSLTFAGLGLWVTSG
ncbi:MAG: fluoride efflux transporter CrcB [Propionibacteriaceae bacterium]|nr:fluoride efflux transporter CrcB [Propionibacteriaceae bacterium]